MSTVTFAVKDPIFYDCVSHLLPVDLVEKKLSKLGTKRSYDALVSPTSLLGRGSVTRLDLHLYPTLEYKKLARDKKDELSEWRKTPKDEAAMKATKKQRRSEAREKIDEVDVVVNEVMMAV